MSVVAFARRVGVDEKTIRMAIRTGRLERSIGRNAKGTPYIADAVLAEQEWRENRDPSRERGAQSADASSSNGASGITIADERKRLIRAQARRAEIENDKRAGDLVPARQVELRWTGLVVEASVAARGLPTRAKQRIPHLSVADVLVLTQLVDEMLEGLATAARPEKPKLTRRKRARARKRTVPAGQHAGQAVSP